MDQTRSISELAAAPLNGLRFHTRRRLPIHAPSLALPLIRVLLEARAAKERLRRVLRESLVADGQLAHQEMRPLAGNDLLTIAAKFAKARVSHLVFPTPHHRRGHGYFSIGVEACFAWILFTVVCDAYHDFKP